MKICVAQIKPKSGDIGWNIQRHKQIIDRAVMYEAELIIFPELSLIGYYPTFAKTLSTSKEDIRFEALQAISDSQKIIIGIGAPLQLFGGTTIAMVIFQPQKEREVYYKKYLHKDEEPFFVSGPNLNKLLGYDKNISLAICYELSVSEHSEKAYKSGAKIYIASVAKHRNNIEDANKSLSKIAKTYSMVTLMSNCVGECDGDICTGNSAVWNSEGKMIAHLNEKDEGIIILDTISNNTFTKYIFN